MHTFDYHRPLHLRSALALIDQLPGAQFIAGGTSQVDLMKEGVQRPSALLDISRLPLTEMTPTAMGGLRIGANVTNADAADHPLTAAYPALREALHAGASQQIRNVASMAGNMLQRTRCPYLRDPAQPCNKRDPGTGCAAIGGFNRLHAIFGQADEGRSSPHSCIAVHPSDLAVGLAAHEAVLVVQNAEGERRMAFDDLHRLPDGAPERDTNLAHGDLIVAIELPAFTGNSHYLKVRDRSSYAYALASCAIAIEMNGAHIGRARIALGSVAAKPWRAHAAEALLEGAAPSDDLFHRAATVAIEGARTYPMNAYKPVLCQALVQRGLRETTGLQALAGPAGTAAAASVGGIAGVRTPQEIVR